MIVYLITFVVFTAVGARNLLIPLYADSLGASRATVGILFSVYFLCAASLAIPAGLLASRFGQRGVIVGALLVAGVAQLASGLTSEITVLLACQVSGGIAFGAVQTVLLIALADAVPAARIGRAIGLQTLSSQLSQMVGATLAGLALARLGLDVDLIVVSGAFGAALFLAVFGIGSTSDSLDLRAVTPGGIARLLRASRGLTAPGMLAFGGTLILGTCMAYIPLFAKRGLGLRGYEIGYLLAIQTAANAATRIPAGRVVDALAQSKLRWVPVVGIGTYSIGLALLPHARNFHQAALLLFIITPFLATAYVAIASAFARVSGERRSIVMGMYTLLVSAGSALGPAAFGAFMEQSFVVGFTATALVGVAICGGALTLASSPKARLD